MTWRPIAEYKVDDDGIGNIVPVSWKRGARIVRMAEGYFNKYKWSWSDPYANEKLDQPDFWFDLPKPPRE